MWDSFQDESRSWDRKLLGIDDPCKSFLAHLVETLVSVSGTRQYHFASKPQDVFLNVFSFRDREIAVCANGKRALIRRSRRSFEPELQ